MADELRGFDERDARGSNPKSIFACGVEDVETKHLEDPTSSSPVSLILFVEWLNTCVSFSTFVIEINSYLTTTF